MSIIYQDPKFTIEEVEPEYFDRMGNPIQPDLSQVSNFNEENQKLNEEINSLKQDGVKLGEVIQSIEEDDTIKNKNQAVDIARKIYGS